MIKVEQHEPRPLKWWHEQYGRERLDMHPPYQRRSYIWTAWKQAHLIDSIINGFDVPKFYVADFLAMPSAALNERRRPYAIIDGKQRLQAIFDFFDDTLSLNQTFQVYDSPGELAAGMTYSRLRAKFPYLAEKIESFVPAVMRVVTDSPEMIEELFVRLNSGEAVTGAERRNAMAGPVPAIIRDLVLHPFFQHKVNFSTKRMQDHNLAAKILLLESKNGFVDTKARNLDEFARAAIPSHERLSENAPLELGLYGEAGERVYATLERMTPHFQDKDPLLSAQGHIPVYYWVARQRPDLVPLLRPFLQGFTAAITKTLRQLREDPEAADPELTNYYTMGRTTNDQASLQGRYDILVKRLSRYANSKAKG